MRRKAKGVFNLDLKSGHSHHFLVSTVTGIAPFISYVRTMCLDLDAGRQPDPFNFIVLQGASRADEFAYDRELLQVAERFSSLVYIPTVSRPWECPDWKGERGRVDDLVRKFTDTLDLEPETTTAYLCGNPGMIVNARGILRRRGYDPGSIKEETYWAPGEGEVEY
jgi:ferredoxin--NADP+ reductase